MRAAVLLTRGLVTSMQLHGLYNAADVTTHGRVGLFPLALETVMPYTLK